MKHISLIATIAVAAMLFSAAAASAASHPAMMAKTAKFSARPAGNWQPSPIRLFPGFRNGPTVCYHYYVDGIYVDCAAPTFFGYVFYGANYNSASSDPASFQLVVPELGVNKHLIVPVNGRWVVWVVAPRYHGCVHDVLTDLNQEILSNDGITFDYPLQICRR